MAADTQAIAEAISETTAKIATITTDNTTSTALVENTMTALRIYLAACTTRPCTKPTRCHQDTVQNITER